MSMQSSFIRFFIATLFFLPCFALWSAAETFTLDDKHSYVLWRIGHMGFSVQSGKWYVNGTVVLDKDHPANSKVNATIKLEDIVTGIPELDKHLKGKQFFDVAKFPTATFVSNKVELLGKDAAKVEGILSLHGVSKPVTLAVKLNQVGKNPINDKLAVGFTASTTIKRSDFGIKAFLPKLADEVSIEIGAEAFHNSPAQPGKS